MRPAGRALPDAASRCAIDTTTWGCRAGRRSSWRRDRGPRQCRPCGCRRSPDTAAARTVWCSAEVSFLLNVFISEPGRRRTPAQSASVVLDLVERHSAIRGVFAGKAQYPFANHVASHLRCAAAERRGLPRQVALADEEQLGRPVDDAGAAGDRQCGVDLERNFLGLEKPDERSARRGSEPSSTPR